jgi:hypothetical protein
LQSLTQALESDEGPSDAARTLAEASRLLELLLSRRIELRPATIATGSVWIPMGRGQFLHLLLNLAMLAREAMPMGGRLGVALDRLPGGSGSPMGQALLTLEAHRSQYGDPPALPAANPAEQPRMAAALGVARALADGAGGSLEIHIDAAEGPRYQARLPLCEGPLALDGRTLLAVAMAPGYGRDLLAEGLAASGARVRTADGLAPVLAMLKDEKAEAAVLILDEEILNKECGGILDAVEDLGQNIHVMLLAASSSAPNLGIAMSRIPSMSKPVAMKDLVSQVRKLIQTESNV